MVAANMQLMKLVESGLSVKEAAEALGLEVSSAEMAVQSIKEPAREVTLEELITSYKPKAVEVLANVMLHGENESARVKAAQIILEGQGQLPEIHAVKLRSMLDKVITLSDSYKAKIIDLPAPSDNKAEEDNQCVVGAV